MADAKEVLKSIELNEEEYVALLTKLIGEAEHVQNNPPELIPQEDKVIRHVLEFLKPYSKEEGGALEIEHVSFKEGRGNLLLKYAGQTDAVVSFVGSHLDVVPANPETWERNPFELTREGDKLYGRGTTDCLGHVALLSCLFAELARKKPVINTNVHCVFIASEEASGPGLGIDGLMNAGKIAPLKGGPIIWVDCSDSEPCLGTASVFTWTLTTKGFLFHSGLPHKGINALELGMEALKEIQTRFYKDFPTHEKEAEYKFLTSCTMKPTQMSVPKGGLNQLPPSSTISGDCRLVPFYKPEDVRAKLQEYVADINKHINDLPTRGPHSKYSLPTGVTGEISIAFGDHALNGIACDKNSPGFKNMCDAIQEVRGSVNPFAIGGSLPLVGEMQESGYDIQLVGFGLSDTYHADNEYCKLSDMKDAVKILCGVLSRLG